MQGDSAQSSDLSNAVIVSLELIQVSPCPDFMCTSFISLCRCTYESVAGGNLLEPFFFFFDNSSVQVSFAHLNQSWGSIPTPLVGVPIKARAKLHMD